MKLTNENMTRDYVHYECIINGQLEDADDVWARYGSVCPSTTLYRGV